MTITKAQLEEIILNESELVVKERTDMATGGYRFGRTYSRPGLTDVPALSEPGSFVRNVLDGLQAGLSVVGFAGDAFAGAGAPFDAANAMISTARGRAVDAVLNAVSVIPGADIPAKGALLFLRALDKGLDTLKIGSKIYSVAEVGKYVSRQIRELPLERVLSKEQLAVLDKEFFSRIA